MVSSTPQEPFWWQPLSAVVRGELRFQVPLAHYSSWRVGGCADGLFQPADAEDVCTLLKHLPASVPVHWLGLGSNTLIRDGGLRGMVILPLGRLNTLQQINHHQVMMGAGIACAQGARFCARLGLRGAEFLAGIPGTIGGALMMNAGCFGSDTWSHVDHVMTVDRQGDCYQRWPQDFDVTYRHVVPHHQHEWFLSATFTLQSGDSKQSLAAIRELLDRRTATQPTGDATCGSVFKNPPGDFAARLIEASGLKGLRIGGASVSMKHANFILNEGTATAADIEQLIHRVKEVVKQQWQITLETEVHCLGELL
ncbi:MAG: UDP-N-acetylmuramate dehydrogenase [Gammaproteobacteria bacterium]